MATLYEHIEKLRRGQSVMDRESLWLWCLLWCVLAMGGAFVVGIMFVESTKEANRHTENMRRIELEAERRQK